MSNYNCAPPNTVSHMDHPAPVEYLQYPPNLALHTVARLYAGCTSCYDCKCKVVAAVPQQDPANKTSTHTTIATLFAADPSCYSGL